MVVVAAAVAKLEKAPKAAGFILRKSNACIPCKWFSGLCAGCIAVAGETDLALLPPALVPLQLVVVAVKGIEVDVRQPIGEGGPRK